MSSVINQEEKSSYRSIFKATSLFGGVQVYQIFINLLSSKVIAVLLGPVGVGLIGLYKSAIQLIQSLTAMGLSSSAVRDISEAYGKDDNHRIGLVVTVLRKLVWYTGIFGLVAVILLSPLLSKFSFGNYDYSIPFILLSLILLFDQLCVGQKVILQGTRKLKALAKATAIGSTIGFILSIPLYYWFKINGIVPTLILNSLTALSISWYFSRKLNFKKVPVDNKTVITVGKSMLKMGIAMSVSGVMVYLTTYILIGFIRYQSSVEMVGLYTAGSTIMASYTGLVFNAMATDYYPRLAAVNKENVKCNQIINQQLEIAVLLLTPLLTICITFMPYIIHLLYSKEFDGINVYMILASIGMMFKAVSWGVAFEIIAKGNARLYIINETIANLYSLINNLLGFMIGGLTGLGIAFTVTYLLYAIQVFVVARRQYEFSFDGSFLKLFIAAFAIVSMCMVIVLGLNSYGTYIGGGIVLISIFFSIYLLDKRIGIKALIARRHG